jgi:flagellar biogenesis protein FliO
VLRLFLSVVKNFLAGVRSIHHGRRQRSMRLCETLPLGDRRYLALVEVEGRRFLVGAAPNSLSLLAQLSSPEPFSEIEPDASFNAEEYRLWR